MKTFCDRCKTEIESSVDVDVMIDGSGDALSAEGLSKINSILGPNADVISATMVEYVIELCEPCTATLAYIIKRWLSEPDQLSAPAREEQRRA